MPSRRIGPVLAILVAAAALAGCGSSHHNTSSQVSPRAYVGSLCSAVIPFERSIVSRAGLLASASPNDPKASQRALKKFFNAVAADTATAARRVHAAGTPKVNGGAHIATTIDQAFNRLSGAMAQAAAQAKTLPTNDKASFNAAAQRLFTGFRNSMAGISQSLKSSTLRSPALQQAAANTPACKNLGSGVA